MIGRNSFLITFLIIFLLTSVYADEIHLNDGNVIKGKIVKITPTAIEYTPEGSKKFDVFPRGQIKKIIFDNGTVIDLNETNMAGDNKNKMSGNTDLTAQNKNSAERHDGFYFRIALGYGFGKTSIPDFGGYNITYSGPGGLLSTDIGYAIADNIILFLTRSGTAIATTEVSYKGQKDKSKGNDVAFTNTGIGFTAYIMPSNFYFSASVNDVFQSFKGDYIKGNTKSGHGYIFSIGQEWWVSENWGIGLSLFSYFANTKAKSELNSTEYKIKSQIYGFSMTATYN